MTSAATGNADCTILAAHFVIGPRLLDPGMAQKRLAGWIGDLKPDQARTMQDIAARFPYAKAILEGIAESSPYLFDLISADAPRIVRLLQCDPNSHLVALLEKVRTEVAAATSEADVMHLLRRMKAEAGLLIALCDIGGVWPVMQLTRALTDVAEVSAQCAVRYLLDQEVACGRLLPLDASHPEAGSGLVVLAMGKMGAGELNYSSDIDLIVFYDAGTSALAENIEPSSFFVKVAQGLSRILQQRTGEGYVFRVDLRLRPDPASTPVAISTAAALHYYEREGRTWERAALIKARPCAGDIVAGDFLLSEIAPFIWRKYLDFAALTDIHDMKRQMQTFRSQSEISVEGHNIKIGRGGIREIEFFAQTQQLIAGGRHPELRIRPTLEALNILAAGNWITFEARDELTKAYEFLRRVEHRLQMIADEQTHVLPADIGGMEKFARFLGYDNRESFAQDLLSHLRRVQSHYGQLFERDPGGAERLSGIDYAAGAEDSRLVEHLLSLGFKKPIMMADIVQRWMSAEYRVFKIETTRQAFHAFVPDLVRALSRAEEPDAAVVVFDRFLQTLQRGGRLISLLSQNEGLVTLVALILGAAPRLGEMLVRQPQVVDGLIDPRFFGAMPDQSELSARLAATLTDADTYEEFLDRLRLFGQESLFLIGARILSGTVSARDASAAFANVAEGITRTVHGLVTDQFVNQYGRIQGQETAILAMGKLGSCEMTASSDLDLILIYDFDHDHPDSDGNRILHGSQYFARFTQRLIRAFTTRTNYGVLYEIDMRLRPSGRAGPVASRIDSFAEYQEHEAWTWEHMALTRARVISASPEFQKRIEDVIRDVLIRPRNVRIIANDVLEMRRAIAEEKGENDIWDMKYAAGGMVDIEFIAQYLQLVHASNKLDILDINTSQVLAKAMHLGLLSQADFDVLRPAVQLYHDLTQILRLCVSDRFNPETAGEDLLRVMTLAGDAPDFSALEARVQETQTGVREVFLKLIEGAT